LKIPQLIKFGIANLPSPFKSDMLGLGFWFRNSSYNNAGSFGVFEQEPKHKVSKIKMPIFTLYLPICFNIKFLFPISAKTRNTYSNKFMCFDNYCGQFSFDIVRGYEAKALLV
jgi:hypothetical protein